MESGDASPHCRVAAADCGSGVRRWIVAFHCDGVAFDRAGALFRWPRMRRELRGGVSEIGCAGMEEWKAGMHPRTPDRGRQISQISHARRWSSKLGSAHSARESKPARVARENTE